MLGTRLFYFSDEKRERPLGAIELKECFGVYSVPLARHGRYGAPPPASRPELVLGSPRGAWASKVGALTSLPHVLGCASGFEQPERV